MAYVPDSGSVVAFQGTSPWLVTGSVQAAANQSVSGTVGASTIGHSPVVIVGGSIAASFTPPANQSVSGTVQAELLSTNASVIVVGSFAPAANQSVSGTVGASIIGLPPVNVTNFPVSQNVSGSVVAFVNALQGHSVSGTVNVGNFPATQNISGSVISWLTSTDASVITVGTAAPNQSVSGTVDAAQIGAWRVSVLSSTPSSMLVGASLIGLSPVSVSNFPTTQNVSGSVVAFGTLGASVIGLTPVNVTNTNLNVSGSVVAWLTSTSASVITVGTAAPNQSVSGTVDAAQIGAWRVSVVSSTPSSMLVGASIIGLTPVSVTFPTTQNVSGSVVAFQGAGWSGSVAATVTNFPTTQNVSGSVVSFRAGQTGTVITSISGNFGASIQGTVPVTGPFAEDAAHTSGDLGFPAWGVRNDAVSSFTSAERDYSAIAVDAAGRNIVVPFAGQQACLISYFGSVVSGSVQLIQPSVIGSRSYITDFWLSNTGAATTLVTFQGGDTSIVGQFIAPTGGGMSSPGIAIPLRTTLSQDLAFKVSPSSSVLYVTLKGYQAP